MCKAVHANAACYPSVRDCFCNRESRESQPCSASCCRSSLLPSSHKPVLSLCFVYRKRWGLDTLHSQRRKKNKDEIQVRSHPETRRQGLACEHRPPQRCGYFWTCKGFTQWVYITGIPLVSALKRNGSSRWAELKQPSVTLRSNINRLYKYDIFLYDLSGLTITPISL